MYKIKFYYDSNNKSAVKEYLEKLGSKKDKDSRIKFNKIVQYIDVLAYKGKAAGEPYIKHLRGDIWEIRPTQDRILFAALVDNEFILLHHFIKKTQKTPQREIEQAERLLKDYKKRC